MYLTKEDTHLILKNIQSFENDLNNTFLKRGYSLRNNLGRRNALISLSQEHETAALLRKKFKDVIEDGSPGKPDIYIKDIDTELECKITSGSRSKGSISYSLQTDWRTLCHKGSLDYLYIIADESFEKFCVIFFEGLTPDDFFPPASGSRGKSRMNKTKAMKKAKCLVGDIVCLSDVHIKNNQAKMRLELEKHILKMRQHNKDFDSSTDMQSKIKIRKAVDKQNNSFYKRWQEIDSKLTYWKTSPKRYKFIFDKI